MGSASRINAVRYADYPGRSGVAVLDEAAFEEMRGGTSVGWTAPAPVSCPAGSVPIRRITLDDLVKFPTPADFLGKGPAGKGIPLTHTR